MPEVSPALVDIVFFITDAFKSRLESFKFKSLQIKENQDRVVRYLRAIKVWNNNRIF